MGSCRLFLCYSFHRLYIFFFQAEDGIRDYKVTGVQTCALPISAISTMVVGFLWYSPLLFANAWIREMGYDPNDKADRKSTRLNSSHLVISYAVFCLKKKNKETE